MPMSDSQLIEKLALQHFDIENLEEQRSDRLDFHEVHVVSVRKALQAAIDYGRQTAAEHPASA